MGELSLLLDGRHGYLDRGKVRFRDRAPAIDRTCRPALVGTYQAPGAQHVVQVAAVVIRPFPNQVCRTDNARFRTTRGEDRAFPNDEWVVDDLTWLHDLVLGYVGGRYALVEAFALWHKATALG